MVSQRNRINRGFTSTLSMQSESANPPLEPQSIGRDLKRFWFLQGAGGRMVVAIIVRATEVMRS
jgi:hypothetical protein